MTDEKNEETTRQNVCSTGLVRRNFSCEIEEIEWLRNELKQARELNERQPNPKRVLDGIISACEASEQMRLLFQPELKRLISLVDNKFGHVCSMNILIDESCGLCGKTVNELELPGMWENADFTGGETDA